MESASLGGTFHWFSRMFQVWKLEGASPGSLAGEEAVEEAEAGKQGKGKTQAWEA